MGRRCMFSSRLLFIIAKSMRAAVFIDKVSKSFDKRCMMFYKTEIQNSIGMNPDAAIILQAR